MKALEVFSNRQFQCIAVSHLGSTLAMNLAVPILPVFFHGHGFSESQIGLLMGATAAGALFLRPWVGLTVDTKGSRPAILTGQLLIAVALTGYLVVSGFAAFFGLRLLFGVALAFYGTGTVTFASSVETGERATNAIAVYTLITMLAIGGAMGVSQLAFDSFGFTALVVASLFSLAVAMSTMLLRSRPIKPASGGKRLPFFTVLRTNIILATAACQFGASFTYGAIFTFIPLASLAAGVSFYSLFFISFAALVLVSRFFVKRANELWGLEKTALYSNVALIVSILLLLVGISPVSLVVAGALFGAGFGLIFPTLVLLLVQRISAASRGTSLSILIAAGDIGAALSAALLGSVAEHAGFQALFVTAVAVLAAISVFYFRRVAAD